MTGGGLVAVGSRGGLVAVGWGGGVAVLGWVCGWCGVGSGWGGLGAGIALRGTKRGGLDRWAPEVGFRGGLWMGTIGRIALLGNVIGAGWSGGCRQRGWCCGATWLGPSVDGRMVRGVSGGWSDGLGRIVA